MNVHTVKNDWGHITQETYLTVADYNRVMERKADLREAAAAKGFKVTFWFNRRDEITPDPAFNTCVNVIRDNGNPDEYCAMFTEAGQTMWDNMGTCLEFLAECK